MRGVGQIVGHVVEIHLLRRHSAGRGVQSSKHSFPLCRFDPLQGDAISFGASVELDPGQILRRNAVKCVVVSGHCALQHVEAALHANQTHGG